MVLDLNNISNDEIFKVINDKNYNKKLDVCTISDNVKKLELQRNLQTKYETNVFEGKHNDVINKHKWENDDYMSQILKTGLYVISDSEKAFIDKIKKIEPISETRTRTRTESKMFDDYDYVIKDEIDIDQMFNKDDKNNYICFYCSNTKPKQHNDMKKHIDSDKHKKSVENFNNKYSNFEETDDKYNFICHFCKNIIPKKYMDVHIHSEFFDFVTTNDDNTYSCWLCDFNNKSEIEIIKHVTPNEHIIKTYDYDFDKIGDDYKCHFCNNVTIPQNEMNKHVNSTDHKSKISTVRVECNTCKKWKLLSKERKENEDDKKDIFECDTCLKTYSEPLTKKQRTKDGKRHSKRRSKRRSKRHSKKHSKKHSIRRSKRRSKKHSKKH